MNAVITPVHEQPEFAENLAAKVYEEIDQENPDRAYADNLQIVRPDYSQPIGLRNLFRTTYHIEHPDGSPGLLTGLNNRFVHVSNILYGTNHDTIAVVYECKARLDKDGQVLTPATSATRHYTDIASFPEVAVTYHTNDVLVRHIADFLTKRDTRF